MRLFVGVPVSCGDVLGPVRNTLQRLDGVRPVPEGTEHVTLRFLGDMDEADMGQVGDAVGAAVASSPAMDAAVTRLGAFRDPRHAHVVWAAVEADGLTELQGRVEDATSDMGQPEAARAFIPHVTLARCKRQQDLRSLMEEYPGPFWEGRLDEVVLFSSRLTAAGPRYERVRTWTLG